MSVLGGVDRRTVWARTDWGIVIAGLGLSGVGALLVWSATRHTSGSQYLLKTLVNLGVGLVCFVLVTRIDHRTLRAWAPWVYLVSLAGLVLVLSPVGSTVNGSRSWIQLPGGFSVQPSEFVKVALCVGLAMILAERRDRDQRPSARDLVLAGVVTLVPVGLVLLQPDLGSALVLVAMAFGVVAVAGAPKRLLLAVGAIGVVGVAAMFTTRVLSAYQRARLTAFLDPSVGSRGHRLPDPAGADRDRPGRVVRARGCSRGRRRRAARSRSSRPTSCSRWRGRSGGSWALRASSCSSCSSSCGPCSWGRAVTRSGSWSAWASRVWFAVQAFENIGMNLGIMPVTGLPLPFLSYGGSSMFAAWLALGLVNNVHLAGTAHRR